MRKQLLRAVGALGVVLGMTSLASAATRATFCRWYTTAVIQKVGFSPATVQLSVYQQNSAAAPQSVTISPAISPGASSVFFPGSGGVGGNVDRWSQELNRIGLATLVIDSFTARGIQSTSANQAQLGRLNMVLDSYRALGVLAAHPRIDPARIVLMGFSRGGQATLYASLKRFERMHGPEGATFAAYLPFYAPCFTTYIGDEDVSDKPIRLFHGIADDYVPVAPCRAYVERLRKAGKNVTLTEYPDANHAFDNPLLKVGPAPQAQTTRRCTMTEEPMGTIINAATKQPFTMQDPCVERGPNVGYNAAATAAATQAVKEFLQVTLKLN